MLLKNKNILFVDNKYEYSYNKIKLGIIPNTHLSYF